jgi:hypothetical protein
MTGLPLGAVVLTTNTRPPDGHRAHINFTDLPDSARLQASGGPGQATHKVSWRDAHEVDAEVVHLLRAAYEQNP